MSVNRVPTICDFSQSSLEYAASVMNVPLHSLRVYTARSDSVRARKLQGEHGFELVIVPDALLPTCGAWAAECGTELMWSPGI